MRKTPISPGDKYGRWTVVALGQTGARRRWLCRCDCGSQSLVATNDLTSGHSISCGCYGREQRISANTKHGSANRGRKTALYQVWCSMIKRCHSETEPGFKNYGARGIKVCDRWRNDFSDFLADMGEPEPGQSIERDDVNGNYEPENCRWASKVEQANNARSNVMLATIDGVMTIAEFAKRYGLNYAGVQKQIKRHGVTEIAGINFRIAGRRDSMRPPPPEEIVAVLARRFNVEPRFVINWIKRGNWSQEKAA